MVRIGAIFGALALFCLSGSAASAAEIGRVTLNGRVIIVDDSGTWAYAEPGAASNAMGSDCSGGILLKSKKVDVSLCVREPWKIQSDANESFEYSVYDLSNEIYSGLITERAAMPIETLEFAIIANAASATGVAREQIPVVRQDKLQINGREWRYIEYDVNLKGAEFRFGNYYTTLGETGAVQYVFWCSKAYFDSNRSAIEALASTLMASEKIN
jgi:hypothetical protein